MDPEKQILSEVIYIESFKKHNHDEKFNDDGCCNIF